MSIASSDAPIRLKSCLMASGDNTAIVCPGVFCGISTQGDSLGKESYVLSGSRRRQLEGYGISPHILLECKVRSE